MKDANDISTREAMFDHFAHGMAKQVDSLIAEGGLEPGRGLLKTYVLEADQRAIEGEGTAARVTAIGNRVPGVERVEPMADGDLFKITWNVKGTGQAKRHTLFLDTQHDRMWRLYGDSTSEATDRFWRTLTKTTSWLDATWLPRQFLGRLYRQHVGTLTGVTSKFVQRVLSPEKDEDRRSLSVKVWGTRAPAALEALQPLQDSFALTGLRLRYYGGSTEAAHDEITFDGKLTCWGRSLPAHNELVGRIFDDEYLGLLEDRLEERFRIRSDDDGGILGEPAYIRLTTPIASMDGFVKDILSSPRFRLVEMDKQVSETFARIVTVDEHVGQSVVLEVLPERIRVMLTRSACSNTLLRILTIIQQDFDPAAELLDGDGNDVLA